MACEYHYDCRKCSEDEKKAIEEAVSASLSERDRLRGELEKALDAAEMLGNYIDDSPERNQQSMDELKVPFTRALTVILTKDAPVAQQQADDHLKAVQDGSQVIFHPTNEAYFHRLRRRVSENPGLAEQIVVFYQGADGTLKEVGLRYEDELRWPVGFCGELWDEEKEISKIRGHGPLRSDEELRAAGCTCIDARNECLFHKPKK